MDMVKNEFNLPLKTFDTNEIVLGRVLGTGGFSTVYSVQHKPSLAQTKHQTVEFDLENLTRSTKHREVSPETTHCSSSPSTNATSSSSSFKSQSGEVQDPDKSISSSDDSESLEGDVGKALGGELALKALHSKTLGSAYSSRRAAEDMAYEVAILSSLPQHPNIIKLHGVSADFFSRPSDAFLVLEKLEEPLDRAIVRWKSEKSDGLLKRVTKPHLSKSSQAERIRQVCVDLASAMNFLHSRRIIFRDLKPANIGLDREGTVRLFDFACARIMQNKPGAKMKHRCGTLRYMAPEVARKEPYDRSADVYSFGMVLWEVAALERPYEMAQDRAELTAKVVEPGKHPKLKRVSSVKIQKLLEGCWKNEPDHRPCFRFIHQALKSAVADAL